MVDKEKAEMLGRAFAAVHSGDHLLDIHKQQKDLALRENKDVKLKREDGTSTYSHRIRSVMLCHVPTVTCRVN